MAEMKPMSIPKQSLVKIGIYLAAILLVAYFGNVEAKNKVARLDTDIARTKGEIRKQESLYPIYVKLRAEYDRKVLNELELVQTVPMKQDEVDKATDMIDRMATLAGIDATNIQPDPSSLAEDPNQLLVNGEFSGDYGKFREFLKKLGAIQYVKHIQQIVAQEAAQGLIYTMKLRLAVLSSNATEPAAAQPAKPAKPAKK
ncbi:hypothetical protein [Megalodesulfovibrio paquesii]